MGRIGRAKERKEREGRGEGLINSLVFCQSGHFGQLSASGADQGQRVLVAAAGRIIGRQVGL